MRTLATVTITTALALGLAACGDAGDSDGDMAASDNDAPAIELDAIQEANFERTSRAEFISNYDELREGLADEGPDAMPPRTEMNFAFLDRDGDEKLSPAEYALIGASKTAVPAINAAEDPEARTAEAGAPAKPSSKFLSDAEIEETLREFFSHDMDGNSFLSESEFAEATSMPKPDEVQVDTDVSVLPE